MAKQSGMGARFLVGGYDVSGDIQALDTISGGPELLDLTDITQSAHSRLGGQRDGHLAFTSYMDVANAHVPLSSLPTADTLMTVLLPTLAVGNAAACLNAKEIGYDPTRSSKGDLTLKVAGEGSGFGLEWGKQLTAGLRTDTTATAGTFFDDSASSAFGGQAYLQVTGFAGTSVTVAIQHATTSGGSYSNILAFTAVTAAPAFQRISVSNVTTINEFLKVTTTGTFSSAVFSVVFCRNPIAGVTF